MGDDEKFIRQLEEALAAIVDPADAEANAFREHAAPLVDEYRGRRTLTSDERDAHGIWLHDFLVRRGAKVSEILNGVDLAIRARPAPGDADLTH
jgi:hypothetical protein